MIRQYDLVIVGAGMVGASLALAILPEVAARGLRVALLDSADLLQNSSQIRSPSYDSRSTALAYGARSFYQRTGVWQALQTHLTPIRQIHVSDRGQFGVTRIQAEEERVPALGYVVENQGLGQVLMQQLFSAQGQGLEIMSASEVTALQPIERGYRLCVEQGDGQEWLEADLVVMADGGRSALREQLGIEYQVEDYQQSALVFNLSLDRPHQHIAYERFTADGPLALLPIANHQGEARCGVVWTQPQALLPYRQEQADRAFLTDLQDAFGYRAGRFLRVGQRFSYPLQRIQAKEQIRSGLVVLGNAAHALHPIAGQGYNLALRGVIDLAENLVASWRLGLPAGSLSRLQIFLDKRLEDQKLTIGMSDQALKLFTSQFPGLACARGLALQALDFCPSAKTLFARRAMGLHHSALHLGQD